MSINAVLGKQEISADAAGGLIRNNNIVKTYWSGNTKVDICSDDIVQTEEEANEIIREMHRIAWKFMSCE